MLPSPTRLMPLGFRGKTSLASQWQHFLLSKFKKMRIVQFERKGFNY
jgi:hypothetical protein